MNNNKLFSPYKLGPITLRNRIIRSAAFELETQILLSNELNYIDENVMKSIMTNLHAIQPKLNSLIKKYGDFEIEK